MQVRSERAAARKNSSSVMSQNLLRRSLAKSGQSTGNSNPEMTIVSYSYRMASVGDNLNTTHHLLLGRVQDSGPDCCSNFAGS